MISTQEEWRQPGTGALLEGAEERLFLETKALYTKKQKLPAGKTRHLESKTDFVHIELPAKLLRSNESNINKEINFVLLKAIKIPSYGDHY